MSCPAASNASRMVAAKAGVPRKARRSLVMEAAAPPSGRDRGFLALQLAELAQDDAALQGGNVIDEHHAFEMVHLVLDAGGEQALGLDLADLVLLVEVSKPDRGWPGHLGILLGQGETALVAHHGLVRRPNDLGIGNLHRLRL